MGTYCVTFKLAAQTVNGNTYEERRQSIIDAVYSENGFWDETTSFILVNSPLNTNDFAAKASEGLSAKHDLLVAFDPEDMSMAYFGTVEDPEVLSSFFRYAKKLP